MHELDWLITEPLRQFSCKWLWGRRKWSGWWRSSQQVGGRKGLQIRHKKKENRIVQNHEPQTEIRVFESFGSAPKQASAWQTVAASYRCPVPEFVGQTECWIFVSGSYRKYSGCCVTCLCFWFRSGPRQQRPSQSRTFVSSTTWAENARHEGHICLLQSADCTECVGQRIFVKCWRFILISVPAHIVFEICNVLWQWQQDGLCSVWINDCLCPCILRIWMGVGM